ncbi:MAG TPA: hypothetical protein VLE43_03505 [Candidatus Saccharimonadia bacterium]|nr:hypothetical protein [Candidatus Saccharimonadia bacterium]
MKFAETLDLVEQPTNTRIVSESTGSGWRWDVPAQGGWNVWLTFSMAWLVFTTLVFGGTFLESTNWTQTLAPLVFPLIGLGILYAGLRASFARHTLEVDPVELVYTRRFLGLTKRRAVRRESIQSVQLACIYVENGEPVYGFEVKAPSGRIRFGSALAPQEKAWLCQQVREALGMELGAAEPTSSEALCEWRGGRLEMERGSGHALVRSQSRAVGTVVSIIGLFFVGVGAFLLRSGSLMWMPWGDEGPAFFYFLFNGSNILWSLGVTGGMLAGFWLLTFGWISRRTTKILQADAQSLSMVATSGRRAIQHRWNVEDVGRMSVVSAMNMNGTPLYHAVVMLPDRVVTFGLGAPRTELHRALSLLSEAMGRTAPART